MSRIGDPVKPPKPKALGKDVAIFVRRSSLSLNSQCFEPKTPDLMGYGESYRGDSAERGSWLYCLSMNIKRCI